jgi:3-hydroxymyristoyl/3-hydroxydecanoyl-(acyl carrier protein) dehydratase
MEDIQELIPQRPPMLMLDQLISCEGPKAKGSLLVKEENVFLMNGQLTESGMIEAIAQTAAARTGWLMKNPGPVEDVRIPVGVIGSIKDFRLHYLPMVNEEINTQIEVVHEFMNASIVKGSVSVQDRLACEVELKIFLTGS